jgi:2-dehydro-3-deoxyphosphogluconate aldolase/(4S)-4-hydroxy-2-oxoglutarate aldolase
MMGPMTRTADVDARTLLERLRTERLLAVLRSVPDVDRVVEGLAAGGLRTVEVTLDSPDALGAIARLRERHPELLVGAGTVRTPDDVEAAAGAGAAFCVAPATVEAAIARAHELGVPFVPGALTPTEVERAWALEPAAVKLFPGSAGGPGYVKELLAPLREVPLVVTGGVDADNAADFLAAGAVAVGAGSSLARAADPEAAARALVAAVRG